MEFFSYATILDKLAESLVLGEGSELVKIAQPDQQSRAQNYDRVAANNEMIDNIKKIYDQYLAQKMSFDEQVHLLSLLPRSWTYEQIMSKFNCSRHAIKIAHKMRDDEDYYFQKEAGSNIRQRVDPGRVRHFITWLVESQLLVSDKIYINSFCSVIECFFV